MNTLSPEEFKKRYGDQALAWFDQNQQAQTQPQRTGMDPFGLRSSQPSPIDIKSGGYLNTVKEQFKGGTDLMAQGMFDAGNQQYGSGNLAKATGNTILGLGRAVTAPFAPIFTEPTSRLTEGIADKVSRNPSVQSFAESPLGQKVASGAEAVANTSEGLGYLMGVGLPKRAGVSAKAPVKAAPEVAQVPTPKTPPPGSFAEKVGNAEGYLRSTVRDIFPTKQRMINEDTAKALDLTPGDLNEFYQSQGVDAGQWLADNNLIGQNKDLTQKAVKDKFTQSYQAVRDEISMVKTEYSPAQIPRFTDSLNAIKKVVNEVPGLENDAVFVENLLRKPKIELMDVQKVKELLDQYHSIYNKSGDVKDAVSKQGLANLRGEVKGFIESEVKKTTGADIAALNKDVSAAKGLDEMITTRSQRGLTRSNWTKGDTPLAMFAYFNPLIGVPAFLIKKAYETPTIRLQIARLMDKLSDAQKARWNADLKENKIPLEVQQIMQGRGIQGAKAESSPNGSTIMERAKQFGRDTVESIRKNGNRGFVKNPFADDGKKPKKSAEELEIEEATKRFDGRKLYHATNRQFDEFDPGINPKDHGTWFSVGKLPEMKGYPYVHERYLPPDIKLIKEADLEKIEFMDDTRPYPEPYTAKGYRGIEYDNGTVQLWYPESDTLKAENLPDYRPRKNSSPSIPQEGKMSIKDLSTAKNALKENDGSAKAGGVDRAIQEITSGKMVPIRVRKLEDGSWFIEDGRHRLEAAKQLGLDNFPIEDVTKEYQAKQPRVPKGKTGGGRFDRNN